MSNRIEYEHIQVYQSATFNASLLHIKYTVFIDSYKITEPLVTLSLLSSVHK